MTTVANKIKQFKAIRDMQISRMKEAHALSLHLELETDNTKKLEFKLRGQDLSDLQSQFLDNHQNLVTLAVTQPDYDLSTEDQIRSGFEKLYFSTKAIYETLFSSDVTGISVSRQSSSGSAPNVRLPKISLPTFNGDIKSWPSFFDLYNSLIHNSSLSPIEKFQYLVSSLLNEPLNLVKALPLTADNYETAYNCLVKRYQNKRLLATAYWLELVNFPKMVKEAPQSLRKLLDTFTENIAALRTLKFPTAEWDFILFNTMLQKLDTATATRFELQHSNIVIPSFEQLKVFIEGQCKALDSLLYNKPILNQATLFKAPVSKPFKPNWTGSKQQINYTGNAASNPGKGCVICNGPHAIYGCENFLAKSSAERYQLVKQKHLCVNCLRVGHFTGSCTSSSTCLKCKQRHHSLLHFDSPLNSHHTSLNFVDNSRGNCSSFPHDTDHSNSLNVMSDNSPSVGDDVQQSVVEDSSLMNMHADASSFSLKSLLPTAIIEIIDHGGRAVKLRALIDTGSMASFITEKIMRRLNIKRSYYAASIQAFGKCGSITARGITTCDIRPCDRPDLVMTNAFVVIPEICEHLPTSSFNFEGWSHLKDLNLADPKFNKSASIDMLLGVDILPQIWKSSVRSGNEQEPIAIDSRLGWLVMGKLPPSSPHTSLALSSVVETSLDEEIKRFWTLEEVPDQVHISAEDKQCEQIFTDSHFRDQTGRFNIKLPFKGEEPLFCNSRSIAIKRYLALERRLAQHPTAREEYSQFLNEFLDRGEMEPIAYIPSSQTPQKVYYIPHHSVYKADSSTTKIRVVFDASTKIGDFSLNHHLLSGAKLQKDITTILLKFRLPSIVFTADIKQMFRQIKVVPEHRDYQRILWRESTNEPIKDFRLTVLTFGVVSSPFIALRVLHQLAEDERKDFPRAAEVVCNDIYVDDIVTGCNSLQEALLLKNELIDLLQRGQFELRKWASNSKEFLSTVPGEIQEPLAFDKESHSGIKVLGIRWDPSQDSFYFVIRSLEGKCTKRFILSEIARVFDPLGFLAPVTFLTKHLMQQLWTRGIDWDDHAPDDILEKWSQYRCQLSLLSAIKVPRRIMTDNSRIVELHGFADASERGYGGVVYVRVVDAVGNISVSLVCAKSKVAPLSKVSLPRLELCAAVLLSKLVAFVLTTCTLRMDCVYAWTDSSVTLSWIRSEPYRWKTFIANRVSQIQELLPAHHWQHVPSQLNPADCLSRGCLPSDLVSHNLWWYGPPFLYTGSNEWPTSDRTVPAQDTRAEERNILLTLTLGKITSIDRLLLRYSSLGKIQRTMAYVLRFANRSLSPKVPKSGPFSDEELHFVLLKLIRYVQAQDFHEDILRLKNGTKCSKPLKRLSPFIDTDGLLRVGGRLSKSTLPYDEKHPILLPRKHRITELIIQHYHIQYLHPGQQTLHFLLRQHFWILSAKRAIKSCTNSCFKCFRINPSPASAKMGDLPAFRVSQLKAFQHVGVDFGGPISITMGRVRGSKVMKAYICLFVCASTKALHLELVSQLSTDAFLAALRRFIARRGRCSNIFSDQGTNFVGAARYLVNCMKTASEAERLKWNHNPPAASHFGGLFEAGIKSVKSHLYRVIGEQILTYEELYTVLTQIEAVLNSRPLCEMSSDPNDLNALTPGHFLTLNPLSTLPDPDVTSVKFNRLDRWQLLVRLHQDFWLRWHKEYLHTLQQKAKWSDDSANIRINTLVLVKNEQVKPLHWLLGRVVAVHPGSDGIVRVVTVRTASGELKRPLTKVCPLPLQ